MFYEHKQMKSLVEVMNKLRLDMLNSCYMFSSMKMNDADAFKDK